MSRGIGKLQRQILNILETYDHPFVGLNLPDILDRLYPDGPRTPRQHGRMDNKWNYPETTKAKIRRSMRNLEVRGLVQRISDRGRHHWTFKPIPNQRVDQDVKRMNDLFGTAWLSKERERLSELFRRVDCYDRFEQVLIELGVQ